MAEPFSFKAPVDYTMLSEEELNQLNKVNNNINLNDPTIKSILNKYKLKGEVPINTSNANEQSVTTQPTEEELRVKRLIEEQKIAKANKDAQDRTNTNAINNPLYGGALMQIPALIQGVPHMPTLPYVTAKTPTLFSAIPGMQASIQQEKGQSLAIASKMAEYGSQGLEQGRAMNVGINENSLKAGAQLAALQAEENTKRSALEAEGYNANEAARVEAERLRMQGQMGVNAAHAMERSKALSQINDVFTQLSRNKYNVLYPQTQQS